jgi:hypothetical protein
MRATYRLPGALVLLASFGLIAASCGGAQTKEETPFYSSKEYDENAPPPPKPDDPCMAKGGEPRDCAGNEDCCEGFVCSIDPERSRIRRYCLEG